MNRCSICGRKLKNSETTCGVEFCKVCEGYEKQLAEKDRKINKLSEEHFEMFGDMKDYKNLWLAEQRKNKEIRKQVCEEIREKLKKQIIPTAGSWLSYYDITETNDLLAQIEQSKEGLK